MSFASNVQMTTLVGSGQAVSDRTRLNGLYYTCGSSASTIDLYNGTTASGDPLVSIATPASAGAHNVIIPDGGVLFTNGIYADLGADVASASLIYVGGAKPVAPPGPVVTTYSLGTDYSGTDLGNNGPGQVRLAFYGPYSGAFTSAMNTLSPGDTVSLVVAGQGTFTVTIAGTYQVVDPSNAYIVANNFGIMPDPGYVFTSISFA
jgi:hypothetical protein